MLFLSRQTLVLLVPAALSLASISLASADTLSKTIKTETAIQQSAVQSQKKIDGLDDHTRKALEEYRSATRQAKTLQAYNDHLQALVDSQETEKASFDEQLAQIENTQREIVPLIINMQQSLEQFVALDLPFLPKERQQRVTRLKEMINRADVTNAEKFRRIIEAYQIENDYGNTIEAYRADIELEGASSSVDFLRLGRVALYYQRLDGSETGYWNNAEKRWETLPSEYRNSIRQGLRIARKETAPDLLNLPIPTAKGEIK
ncbi:MAG: DUF3450 family protein [Methyloprofundus sp.]|nr:DUF3450 family protein [Methyloprofundus sp.]